MDKAQVKSLYKELLDSWNKQDAKRYAACFTEKGSVVGFDGSQMNGKKEIASEIERIFADHRTAAYVSKVKEVRVLSTDVALLRAVAGMVPPGEKKLNPAANAVQSLVVVRNETGWGIEHFHNTPARFHGRPERAEALTRELQEMVTDH